MARNPKNPDFFSKAFIGLLIVAAFGFGLQNLCSLGLNKMQTISFVYTAVLVCFADGLVVNENQ